MKKKISKIKKYLNSTFIKKIGNEELNKLIPFKSNGDDKLENKKEELVSILSKQEINSVLLSLDLAYIYMSGVFFNEKFSPFFYFRPTIKVKR